MLHWWLLDLIPMSNITFGSMQCFIVGSFLVLSFSLNVLVGSAAFKGVLPSLTEVVSQQGQTGRDPVIHNIHPYPFPCSLTEEQVTVRKCSRAAIGLLGNGANPRERSAISLITPYMHFSQ